MAIMRWVPVQADVGDRDKAELIDHRGTQVIKGWPEKIEEAQTITFYEVDGTKFERVRYGDEGLPKATTRKFCRGCAVVEGEFHVPSCDVEECPRCHSQAIGCGCQLGITQLH